MNRITQRVIKNRKSKGLFIAFKDYDENICIGYSMCHPLDKWDKKKARIIATDRAIAWRNRQKPVAIPHSIYPDFTKFFVRCRKYFKQDLNFHFKRGDS